MDSIKNGFSSNIRRSKNKGNVLMKTDSIENWKKCEDKYIPEINTILVYQDNNVPLGIKISDGQTLLRDLPLIELNNKQVNAKEYEPSVDGAILNL